MTRFMKFSLCFAFLFMFSSVAFAQTPSPVVPPVNLLAGIGMILGLILGYINEGVSTGTILVFGVPAPWKAYLSLAAVFLTAFIPQFQEMTTFSTNGLFLAIMAGIGALVSYNAGATARGHHEASTTTAAALKAKTGAK
jgi:hypothetical protein